MSKICKMCGKGPRRSNNVSHSNKRTPRRQLPNLQRIKISIDGKEKRVYVCTRCIRSNKAKKVA